MEGSLYDVSMQLIAKDEDLRLKPYKDTQDNLTIGWGHNLDAKGISENVAKLMLMEDVQDAIMECHTKIDFFTALEKNIQYVLVNMAFNMGIGGLLSFTRMLGHLRKKENEEAANELENSLAYTQVPNRLFPLIKILRSSNLGDTENLEQ